MSLRIITTLGLALALVACEKKPTSDKTEPAKEPAAATPNMISAGGSKKPTTSVSPGPGGGGKQPGSSGPTKQPVTGGNEVSPVQKH
jgi:hypothetical protein